MTGVRQRLNVLLLAAAIAKGSIAAAAPPALPAEAPAWDRLQAENAINALLTNGKLGDHDGLNESTIAGVYKGLWTFVAEGRAWCTPEAISERCKFDERTVRRALAYMELIGLVIIFRRWRKVDRTPAGARRPTTRIRSNIYIPLLAPIEQLAQLSDDELGELITSRARDVDEQLEVFGGDLSEPAEPATVSEVPTTPPPPAQIPTPAGQPARPAAPPPAPLSADELAAVVRPLRAIQDVTGVELAPDGVLGLAAIFKVRGELLLKTLDELHRKALGARIANTPWNSSVLGNKLVAFLDTAANGRGLSPVPAPAPVTSSLQPAGSWRPKGAMRPYDYDPHEASAAKAREGAHAARKHEELEEDMGAAERLAHLPFMRALYSKTPGERTMALSEMSEITVDPEKARLAALFKLEHGGNVRRLPLLTESTWPLASGDQQRPPDG